MPIQQDASPGLSYGIPDYLEPGLINFLNAKLPASIVDAQGTTINSQGAAAANTALLQTAINKQGLVAITAPGTHYINSVLYVPDNTSVYIGAGVVIKPIDGAPSAVFTNADARHPGFVVAGANATYTAAPDGQNFCVSLSGMSASQLAEFPVGSWISVVVLGHGALGTAGTALAGRGYRGVWPVVFNNGTTLQYEITKIYPGSAPSTNNLTVFPVTENPMIWGPGTIDGNGQNASASFVDGDPQGNVIWWRHAVNPLVDGPRFLRGKTWTIGSNYVRNHRVKNCTPQLRGGSGYAAIDFVHLSGNHQGAIIEGNAGNVADNFVGMTIDCTEGTGFNFPYQAPGDMYGIKIYSNNGNAISEDGGFGVIGIYGPEAYKYADISIYELNGDGSSAVQLSNYATTNQNKLCIHDLRINGVKVNTLGGAVAFTAGVFDIMNMRIENLAAVFDIIPAITFDAAATGTIRSLALDNISSEPYDSAAFTRTVPLVTFGGININALKINNVENIPMAVNISLFTNTGAGNIPKVGISNVSATGSGTGSVWSDTGAGAVAVPVYYNTTYNAVPL